jgi:hypothetical protein
MLYYLILSPMFCFYETLFSFWNVSIFRELSFLKRFTSHNGGSNVFLTFLEKTNDVWITEAGYKWPLIRSLPYLICPCHHKRNVESMNINFDEINWKGRWKIWCSTLVDWVVGSGSFPQGLGTIRSQQWTQYSYSTNYENIAWATCRSLLWKF